MELSNLMLAVSSSAMQVLDEPECRNTIVVLGKNKAEKLGAIVEAGLTGNTLGYAAGKKGKAFDVIRAENERTRVERAAVAAAKGKFTLMYELIVLESGKTIQPITNRETYERARGFISGLRDNLKNGGRATSGKLSAEAVALETALAIFDVTDAAIEAQKMLDAERRRQADEARKTLIAMEQQQQADARVNADAEVPAEAQ